MSPSLPDLMHDAVDDRHPDTDALAWEARRRGLSIRRRRHALATVGVAAATAGVLGLAGQLPPWAGRGEPTATTTTATPTPSATPSPSVSPSPSASADPEGGLGAITGRVGAALLRDSVTDLVAGEATRLRGQDGEVYAELRYLPADGSGFSVIGVNVQPGFGETSIYTCADRPGCRITRPTPGSTLMVWRDEGPVVGGGTSVRQVADLLRDDGVRVVASSTNGQDLPANRWEFSRERPLLGAAELTRIVRDPLWGGRVPLSLVREGEALEGYTDLDGPQVEPTPTG